MVQIKTHQSEKPEKLGGGGNLSPVTCVCVCVCDKLLGSEKKFNQLLFTQIGSYYIQAVRSIKMVGASNAHFKLVLTVGIETLQKKQRATPELLILILPK